MSNLKLEGSSGTALGQRIAAVRRGGMVSVSGVYAGFIQGFQFGDTFEMGIRFASGQTHVHQYLAELLTHIEQWSLPPQEIISHRLFDCKEDNCRRGILTP